MEKTTTYVGLDVHKDTIVVALAEMGVRGEVREYRKIAHTLAAVKALTMKLASRHSEIRFCYKAGPCGYGIQRQLASLGHECVVVAPSLIPRKPGDRIKTDGRDAGKLATLHRAGELTPVWVPDQAHEAMRDFVRARQAAVRSLRQARQRLSGFLLRYGHHYQRPAWTKAHRRWLSGLKFDQPAYYIVLEDAIASVEAATARRDRLEAQIEAAWSYRFPARLSREQLLRQEHLAKLIRDIAWKAQERLCRRYRKMARDGKLPTVITTAIGRELAGFVWAIARQVRLRAR